MKKIIVILVLGLLFTACEEEKEKELVFENYSVERSFNDCNPETDSACTYIRLSYPLVVSEDDKGKNINRKIEQHVIQIVDYQESDSINTAEAMADAFIKDYSDTAEEFAEYELPWEASVYGDLMLKTGNLISVRFDSEVFSGGAHGYSSVTFMNINPKTGKLYSEDELFKAGFKDFAEKQFRRDQQIAADESINSTGMFFENDQFQLPENIGFTDNKVILHYNPYEIASYAQGSFRMEFSYEEIQKYLKIDLQPEGEKELQALLQNP